ncbi:MAG TPA: hypothetical protein VFS94_07900 [Gemmatimonadales bacterium]|nr:hypothetical protein [Gemmatimonadales bacterium]
MHDPLHLERPRAQATATGSRVTARVGGADVWFESPDIVLVPSIEAFVAAFLIPSLGLRRPLAVAGRACPEFVANTRQVVELAHQWWRYPKRQPTYHTTLGAVSGSRGPRAALFFSGGLDSFHSLLASGRHVDDLVFVHGFDVPLIDTPRADACERLLRDVAASTGQRVIRVRTNLRQHPELTSLHWGRTHGGALAAVGHLLSGHVTSVLISSSNPLTHRGGWGSHWALDRWWSSGSLRVEHVGAECDREQKLAAVARHPLVRQHLRVCWENRDAALNCGRCEKCLRTQLGLLAQGELSHSTVFDHRVPIAQRLDRLQRINDPVMFAFYQRMIERGLPPDVGVAARRLLRRSRTAHRVRLGRHLVNRAGGAARRLWRASRRLRGRTVLRLRSAR